jgi:hypothetical protein
MSRLVPLSLSLPKLGNKPRWLKRDEKIVKGVEER